MYYVNKIVGWVMSPLGVFFLGLLLSAVLRRRRAASRVVLVASVLFLWICSIGFSQRFIAAPLELPPVDLASLPEAEAIVCLGGGMTYAEGLNRPEMTSGADRVWTAAKLFRLGKAPTVFATGSGAELSTGELLADFGVPSAAIRFADVARNTEEEAREIKSSGLMKVLLVTSAWHLPRARRLFERQGLSVIPVPTDYEMGSLVVRPVEFSDFVPNADALLRNSYALKEWVARVGYWVLGR